ncbi:MAG: alginate export family protein [Gammaproteobacteria bacterium]|nr:alginate export family protein [Gammaproteobacteria bacterium]MDH3750098.1 alginate export family protein [Gammaproteobacteria bacterium]MDH3806612.1 alginate export family protein [Gammaproteobacteria bacterium]
MNRNHNILLGTLLGLILPFSITAAEEEGATDLASAITSGKATVALRYRYEQVDQDSATLDDETANASTLRLRLNYGTSQWNGWSAFAEYDHVFHVLLDDFDSGAGTSPSHEGEYPVVADPSGSDLNQLYFDYSPNADWKLRVGRQRILLDNQRFVGGVGWRQNEQTYDAFTLNTKAIAKTALSYSYLNQVRRIFGQTTPAGKAALDGHLLNAKISVSDGFTVTPYYYLLDYKDAANFVNSTGTFGIRLAGSIKAGEGKVTLLGEFASQSDAGDNPNSYDADYAHVSALWALENGLSIGLAFESLGADSSAATAFRTPLATGHAFNGWADKFLGTPAAGLEDAYVTVKYKAGKWNLTGVYHDFSSEFGSSDYGKEFDIAAGRKLGERYGVLFKGAFFSADSSSPIPATDTDKFWIMLTASY